jgi:PAS domain S-box-containing protein
MVKYSPTVDGGHDGNGNDPFSDHATSTAGIAGFTEWNRQINCPGKSYRPRPALGTDIARSNMPFQKHNNAGRTWIQSAESFLEKLPAELVVGTIILVTGAELALNWFSRLGGSGWFWYVLPLLFSTFIHRRNFPLILAAILSALILAEFFHLASGPVMTLNLASRVVGIAGLWLMALIIERKNRIHEALRASEARYRDLFEMESDAHFLMDQETHRVLHANRAAQRLYGYALAEFLELRLDDFSAEPEASRPAVEAGTPALSLRWHRKKSGERFPVEITINAFESQGQRRLLGAVRDITARRRAEERIAQLSRMRAILAGVDHAILHIHDQKNLLDEICRVAAETGGFKLAWIGVVAPDQSVRPLAQAGAAGYVEKISVSVNPSEPEGRGPIGTAIRENRMIVVENILDDARMSPWREMARQFGLNYVVSCPIQIGGQTMGAFSAYASEMEVFDESELALLAQVSGDISFALTAIANETARKELEWALKTNEERYRTILNEQTDVISRFNADGTLTFVNDFYCRLFGKTRSELLGQKWHPRVVPDDLAAIQQQLGALSPINPVVVIENRIYNAANEVRWFQFVNRAAYDADGILLDTLSVGRDITQSKVAEEQLRKLSRAVEQSPVSIMITDKSGAIEYVNPKFSSLTGYQPDEVIGKNARLLKSGEMNAEKYVQLWRTISGGEEWRGHFHNRKKNGQLFWEAASISPIFAADGKTTHFIAVKEDITAARSMETRLRELAAIVQSSEDAIISATLDQIILSWNLGAQKLFGHSAAEAIGQNLALIISPEHSAQAKQAIRLAREGQTMDSYETVRRHKNGSLRQVSVRVSPITDESGKVMGTAAILRDITLVKQLEKAVLDISAQERRRVGHELHDGLGQHLAGMAFKAKALEQDLVAAESPLVADAKKIVELTNEAMQQTRQLASGFDPVDIEVGGLPTALKKYAHQIAISYRIACHFYCPNERLEVDKQINLALFRIAQEAINNALRHGRARQVDVSLQAEAARLVLTIRDNGKGFSTSGQKHHGRGLGIMSYRANSLGGKLLIRSQPGSGTEIECIFEGALPFENSLPLDSNYTA